MKRIDCGDGDLIIEDGFLSMTYTPLAYVCKYCNHTKDKPFDECPKNANPAGMICPQSCCEEQPERTLVNAVQVSIEAKETIDCIEGSIGEYPLHINAQHLTDCTHDLRIPAGKVVRLRVPLSSKGIPQDDFKKDYEPLILKLSINGNETLVDIDPCDASFDNLLTEMKAQETKEREIWA